jgi:hypothetical protein
VIFSVSASFRETAPTLLTDVGEAERFVRRLDSAPDLMELATSSTALATLPLDVHLEREGKGNHAQAMLETAYWLQSRLDQLVTLWKTLEP